MDFEMRLSGDGLDDLVVTNEELLEASAAVSGLMDGVVNGHHHHHDDDDVDGKDTLVTEVVATTVTMTAIAVDDEEDDEEDDSETEEGEVVASDAEHVADDESADDEAPTQVLAEDDALEEAEEEEIDEEDDMDAFPPTQVINDDEEEEEEEEAGAATESVDQDDEMPSAENEAVNNSASVAVAPVVETSKPIPPQAASPRQQAPSTPVRFIAAQPPVQATPSPKKEVVAAVTANPASAEKAVKEQAQEDISAVAEFSKVLGPVWDMLDKQGWQVAQGKDTIFCAMPGTQFFNFRPNINVFDSKDKACWKFIAVSGEKSDDNAAGDDARLWEILWDVAAQKFAWYTMACGPETLFVKPGTSFAEFLPNETIFQTKKRAVLKCLEIEQVTIELGDSVEGHQVIDFSPKVEVKQETMKTKASATPKQAAASRPPVVAVATPASAATPSPFLKRVKKPKAASTKVSPSGPAKTPLTGAKGRAGAKAAPKSLSKAPAKAGKKVAGGKKATPSKMRTPKSVAKPMEKPDLLGFQTPEFKCTFGLVYKRLQELGWYHQPGKFEYDYFAPEYTPETAILNGNYFRSAAEFEEFLKDSGIWLKVKTELRMEHDEAVAHRRREALERLKQQTERKRKSDAFKKQRQLEAKAKAKKEAAEFKEAAAKEAAAKVKAEEFEAKQEAAAVKEQKKSPKLVKLPTPSSSVRRTSSFASDLQGDLKVSMGKIVKKLLLRGWYYRPGRFEYDYFKPGVNAKTAVLNEDYFQSEAELETYLKTSGLWDEISQELRDEFYAKQEHEVIRISQEEDALQQQVQKRKLLPKSPYSPVSEQQEPKKHRVSLSDESGRQRSSSTAASPRAATARTSAPINEDEVEELTNDIWANSHHFEFERC